MVTALTMFNTEPQIGELQFIHLGRNRMAGEVLALTKQAAPIISNELVFIHTVGIDQTRRRGDHFIEEGIAAHIFTLDYAPPMHITGDINHRNFSGK